MKIDFITVYDGSELADLVADAAGAAWENHRNHENAGDSFLITDSVENQAFLDGAAVTRLPAVVLTREDANGNKIAVARLIGYVSQEAMERAIVDALNGNEVESYYYDQDGNGVLDNGLQTADGFGLFDFQFPKMIWLAIAAAGTYKSIEAKGTPTKVGSSLIASIAFSKYFE